MSSEIFEEDDTLKIEDETIEPKSKEFRIEGEEIEEEQVVAQDDFYANLAEELEDSVLSKISSQLRGDYQRDKDSRKEWEDGYTSGLDLLGFKYTQPSKPFRGASGVTHPLLSEAVTQFNAQAYKELLPITFIRPSENSYCWCSKSRNRGPSFTDQGLHELSNHREDGRIYNRHGSVVILFTVSRICI